jgi:hypothetical protein
MLLPLALAPALAIAAPQERGTSLEQFVATRSARLLAADADGDGKLTLTEWKRARAGAGDPERVFSAIDGDKDGSAARAEIEAFLTARFTQLDANGDKRVTREEAAAARKGAASPGS